MNVTSGSILCAEKKNYRARSADTAVDATWQCTTCGQWNPSYKTQCTAKECRASKPRTSSRNRRPPSQSEVVQQEDTTMWLYKKIQEVARKHGIEVASKTRMPTPPRPPPPPVEESKIMKEKRNGLIEENKSLALMLKKTDPNDPEQTAIRREAEKSQAIVQQSIEECQPLDVRLHSAESAVAKTKNEKTIIADMIQTLHAVHGKVAEDLKKEKETLLQLQLFQQAEKHNTRTTTPSQSVPPPPPLLSGMVQDKELQNVKNEMAGFMSLLQAESTGQLFSSELRQRATKMLTMVGPVPQQTPQPWMMEQWNQAQWLQQQPQLGNPMAAPHQPSFPPQAPVTAQSMVSQQHQGTASQTPTSVAPSSPMDAASMAQSSSSQSQVTSPMRPRNLSQEPRETDSEDEAKAQRVAADKKKEREKRLADKEKNLKTPKARAPSQSSSIRKTVSKREISSSAPPRSTAQILQEFEATRTTNSANNAEDMDLTTTTMPPVDAEEMMRILTQDLKQELHEKQVDSEDEKVRGWAESAARPDSEESEVEAKGIAPKRSTSPATSVDSDGVPRSF